MMSAFPARVVLRHCGRRRPRKGFGVLDLESGKDLATARKRISELERKVGQQQVELDFFRQALRRVATQL